MKSVLAKQPNGTIQLTITIPWDTVKKTKEEVLAGVTQNAKVAGFRKGKAPKPLVEENVNPQKLQEDVLRKVLPDAYVGAVQEHNLRPIMNPKIHVEKVDDEKDWVFSALTCEMPDVKLNNYREAVQKVTAKSKIILPGKEPFDAAQGKKQETPFDEIMKAINDTVTVETPGLLVEQEADRLLSQTLDEIKRLGLSLDQYLASTKKTPDELRKEYEVKAAQDMKIEFTLQKIAENEKITVEEKEIDEAIQKAKDPKEREHLQKNRYLLASIIRQQKTLDFLKQL